MKVDPVPRVQETTCVWTGADSSMEHNATDGALG
jgi:hypothetical protein